MVHDGRYAGVKPTSGLFIVSILWAQGYQFIGNALKVIREVFVLFIVHARTPERG